MDPELGSLSRESRLQFYKTTFFLAFQSLGVVYGDLSISPIYVFKSTFSRRLHLYEDDYEVLGVLSLVLWTLTVIPLLKYIIIVLRADDNGEGGTFALYSLLCRHSKMGLLNSSHDHGNISSYNTEICLKEKRTSLLIEQFFQKHPTWRLALLLLVLLGTSMIIGDGILTPTMSVLSAVYGIQVKAPNLHENYSVVVACIILVGLFALQRYGTHRVGFLFAPILLAWLLCIGAVGIYNILHWNPHILWALSPHYIYKFFKIAGKDAWSSLGGVVLCVTGAEAMFADLGHFSKLSVRITFIGVVYPCLVLAYLGEGAYLSKNKMDLQNSFFKSIPESIFWPVFVIATLATAVGSQAIISATFSIISQCRALSCFPRVKIVHTSSKIHGQIYIPEVNWILMILCLAVTIGFRDTSKIGNAYGLAVITVMVVTTCLMFLIICTVWKQNVLLAAVFVVFFGSVELFYASACLSKVHKGGWVPLAVALVVLSLMSVWHYGTTKKHAYEEQNKTSLERLLALGPSLGLTKVPGIGLIYSNISSGIPPVFAHFITNFPAFHRVLVFVTIQSVMVPKVDPDERFYVGRVGPSEHSMFECIIRYGYKDIRDSYNTENQLVEKISEFLHSKDSSQSVKSPIYLSDGNNAVSGKGQRKKVGFQMPGSCKEEVKELIEAKEAGVVYMMGNTCISASEGSPLLEKLAIDVVYSFLRRNCRSPARQLGVPHTLLIEICMAYYV